MDLEEVKELEKNLTEKMVSRVYLKEQSGQENGEYLLIVFGDGNVLEIGSNDMTGALWFENYGKDRE